MLDQSAISLLIDAAVAAGTLFLAGLTYYQLRILIRERKAAQARELADRVFTPLRKEVALWIGPEEVYGEASSRTWAELKEKAPYLSLRLPRELAGTLDKAEQLFTRVNFLKSQVRPVIQKETNRLGRELALKAGLTGQRTNEQTMLRIVNKQGLIANLDLGRVWSTRMSLTDWAKNYVKVHYPVEDWEVQVLVGPDPAGGTKDAEELARQLFELLRGQPSARELHETIDEITTLGRDAIASIDRELSRPVAPWD
jgi:hypothetical protein